MDFAPWPDMLGPSSCFVSLLGILGVLAFPASPAAYFSGSGSAGFSGSPDSGRVASNVPRPGAVKRTTRTASAAPRNGSGICTDPPRSPPQPNSSVDSLCSLPPARTWLVRVDSRPSGAFVSGVYHSPPAPTSG